VLPGVADQLGVAEVWAKDESSRLGLPSFKVLGASWAAYRALSRRLGAEPAWTTLEDLRAALDPLRPLALRAATDGNHGRAVAWFARIVGLDATILVPAGAADARIEAIASEGATVEVVEGTYDEAVRRSTACDPASNLVVSDTSWEGYEEVPGWVVEGYGTIFDELDEAMRAVPDVVPVQLGVGALGAAAAAWASRRGSVRLLGVEPAGAACVLASVAAGRLTEVPGPHRSIMAGLNCGLASRIALPAVASTFAGFAAVDDPLACDAMRLLANEGVEAGETGAAGLAGLLAVTTHAQSLARWVGLGADARVLLLITEGPTDPEAYRRVVGADASGTGPGQAEDRRR
jgi:diaminopropionate ammonia-lyase